MAPKTVARQADLGEPEINMFPSIGHLSAEDASKLCFLLPFPGDDDHIVDSFPCLPSIHNKMIGQSPQQNRGITLRSQ